MKGEKIKEFREWATFILTALTLVAIPMGAMVLKNQRLEIEANADSKYQTKADAAAFQSVTNAKLDKLADNSDSTRQDIASIRATLSSINERKKINEHN